MTAKKYKQFKGLKKENLRDNMTNKELVLNMLAELSTKEISESKNLANFLKNTWRWRKRVEKINSNREIPKVACRAMTEFIKKITVFFAIQTEKSVSSFLLSLAVETPCLWGLW